MHKPLTLPKSAYADLGDINTAKLEETRTGAMLTIVGGDASESYIARFLFTGTALRKRLIFSGEDSAHPLQTTFYR
jgi:hypothetical protein